MLSGSIGNLNQNNPSSPSSPQQSQTLPVDIPRRIRSLSVVNTFGTDVPIPAYSATCPATFGAIKPTIPSPPSFTTSSQSPFFPLMDNSLTTSERNNIQENTAQSSPGFFKRSNGFFAPQPRYHAPQCSSVLQVGPKSHNHDSEPFQNHKVEGHGDTPLSGTAEFQQRNGLHLWQAPKLSV